MSENESFERLSHTLADAWCGIGFHLNTRVNMRLMHRNKAMSFRSNFRLILPHVNGVIVVGRLPALDHYNSACYERCSFSTAVFSWGAAAIFM